MSVERYHLFLSYCREDEGWVHPLEEALGKAGIKVWLDVNQNPGGRNVTIIARGIASADAFAFVVSPRSVDSRYCLFEASQAHGFHLATGKPWLILPLMYETAELPDHLKEFVWKECRGRTDFELLAAEIAQQLVEKPGHVEPQPHELPEIIATAEKSILISGHTLDKFTNPRDREVTKVSAALRGRLAAGIEVKLIMLNPESAYAKAHRPFHTLESGNEAAVQFTDTLKAMERWAPENQGLLTVLLSNYMPRYRAIIIDDTVCYHYLYTYETDVVKTPPMVFDKRNGRLDSIWFKRISDSLFLLLGSRHVVRLVDEFGYNANWRTSRLGRYLTHCSTPVRCRGCWPTVERLLLGYADADQSSGPILHDPDYLAGMFTLEQMADHLVMPHPQARRTDWLTDAMATQVGLVRIDGPEPTPEELNQKARELLDLTPGDGRTLMDRITYEECPDILLHLARAALSGDPEPPRHLRPNKNPAHTGFVFELIQLLARQMRPTLQQWLDLSIAAESLALEEKPQPWHPIDHIVQRGIDFGHCGAADIPRVAGELWQHATRRSGLDCSQFFFRILAGGVHHLLRLASIPGDYLQTPFLLRFYQDLLTTHPNVAVDLIPWTLRSSHETTVDDVGEFLQRLPGLLALTDHDQPRFRVVENGPTVGGFNLMKLHPEVRGTISKAFAVDVRGFRNYQMMQGLKKVAFFGFMVSHRLTEIATGLPAGSRAFLHQNSGEKSFEGPHLAAGRGVEGQVTLTAAVTTRAADHGPRWTGGSMVDLSQQRKERYDTLWTFYTNKAVDFNKRFGPEGMPLEPEVKRFLDKCVSQARILVLGCGSGREVTPLVAGGAQEVWGLDISSDAILKARENVPQVPEDRFVVADFYNLDNELQGKFGAIVANAALVHLLEWNDMTDILRKAFDRLEPGGLFFVRVLNKDPFPQRGEMEKFFQDLNGVPQRRWFVYYSESELRELATNVGFRVVGEIERHEHWNKMATAVGVYWVLALLERPVSSVKDLYNTGGRDSPDIHEA